nr:MAG TPA: hypothetical protein [Caudoviricetes sp.]
MSDSSQSRQTRTTSSTRSRAVRSSSSRRGRPKVKSQFVPAKQEDSPAALALQKWGRMKGARLRGVLAHARGKAHTFDREASLKGNRASVANREKRKAEKLEKQQALDRMLDDILQD